MNDTKRTQPKANWKPRSSPRILRILLAVLIVCSMATFTALYLVHTDIRRQTEELRQDVADMEHQNMDLNEKKDALGSIDSIKQIARDELGLVDPGTVLVTPEVKDKE